MDYRFQTRDPSRRFKGIVIVVVLHALLGYALVSGLARKGLNFVKKPLEAVVIQEVIIPPPPPPPPPPKKIEKPVTMPKLDAPPPPYVPPPDVTPQVSSNAPAIQSTQVVPTAPAVIAPPPPPAAPVAVGPKRTTIGVACPTQVAPEMPRKALQDGTEGVVKAQIRIKDGVIQDVTILSGPRVFHAAVKDAMMQYKCMTDGGEVIATQEFGFKVE
ncbi:MAG: energy transducer TonB [Gammaproteobacteria bacterium]|nr:energy transducer TonB [Gammaproteobacteria bacterium]MBU3997761.1 energy transducer TonB [Gammaproteobacteria bacterium]MBU4019567.1 energy transducer TonB [Gammaproteobacteria bacterium]MBU4079081.1 energy transducer TonB [Gammaproteobacteria bacterium]MBU4114978.1 energy transducer TonB [Gammaproteobacteria bacterium]